MHPSKPCSVVSELPLREGEAPAEPKVSGLSSPSWCSVVPGKFPLGGRGSCRAEGHWSVFADNRSPGIPARRPLAHTKPRRGGHLPGTWPCRVLISIQQREAAESSPSWCSVVPVNSPWEGEAPAEPKVTGQCSPTTVARAFLPGDLWPTQNRDAADICPGPGHAV